VQNNFLAALIQTVASTTTTAAEAYAHKHPAKGKKKGHRVPSLRHAAIATRHISTPVARSEP
jgi:hypothetical protein